MIPYAVAMSTTRELLQAIDAIAPLRHAASWDNVGLLVGRSEAACHHALLCIDLTSGVLHEARTLGANVIIAYHPVLFEARKNLSDSDPAGALLLELIESGIAVISPHTALDAAPGGMTQWLASAMGEGNLQPLQAAEDVRSSEAYKLVTYVPRDKVEEVRDAMTKAGAGHVGNYDMCTVAIESTGTFRGGEGASPTVGDQGQLESIDECTLMVPCSQEALPGAIAALNRAHPYEEPPVHIIPLAPRPLHDTGSGRLLTLSEPADIDTIAQRLREHLGVESLRMVRSGDEPHTIIGCCPGAGGSMMGDASAHGATLFVTGEMRHHDLLNAKASGVSVLLAGHTNTERGYLPVFRERLKPLLGKMVLTVSQADDCPWIESRSV